MTMLVHVQQFLVFIKPIGKCMFFIEIQANRNKFLQIMTRHQVYHTNTLGTWVSSVVVCADTCKIHFDEQGKVFGNSVVYKIQEG